MAAKTVKTLLGNAGVLVNGPNPWDIQVHDERWYKRVYNQRNLGLGKSYMDGWWDCKRLDVMFFKLLQAGLHHNTPKRLRYLLKLLPGMLFNLQTIMRSRIIAEKHYDLGNDLFFSFLDPYLQYSCAFFQDTQDLNEAQHNKLQLISSKLNLQQKDHLLDIGCGWGGLLKHITERHACQGTGVNISSRQLNHARKFCKELPVKFKDQDYRFITGQYEKIVSVGMFEHVGHKNYRTFMKVVHDCLKKEGIFLLHTIGANRSKRSCDPWITKYIFPNGMLPSIMQISKSIEGLFIIEDVHNLGPNYDKTLMAWNNNFQQTWPDLSKNNPKYDKRFKRMWEYYLLSCAGAFRARDIQVWQLVMTHDHPGRKQPECRF
ncbi:cyclopropane fatty acyl phospholipid synthase [Desulfonatronovibrio hydrogenovorans]|uniref:cyclopropane fatty acyl phospholipid synthase n=1 Tax=Desulfonatronovibrio hydrogenovorans TaxID=53245 RepID=UPI0005509593|nr:cyclopropane fatty acyl phospholipid synthase [Desulfonatronovibrio hydrogenovorans]